MLTSSFISVEKPPGQMEIKMISFLSWKPDRVFVVCPFVQKQIKSGISDERVWPFGRHPFYVWGTSPPARWCSELLKWSVCCLVNRGREDDGGREGWGGRGEGGGGDFSGEYVTGHRLTLSFPSPPSFLSSPLLSSLVCCLSVKSALWALIWNSCIFPPWWGWKRLKTRGREKGPGPVFGGSAFFSWDRRRRRAPGRWVLPQVLIWPPSLRPKGARLLLCAGVDLKGCGDADRGGGQQHNRCKVCHQKLWEKINKLVLVLLSLFKSVLNAAWFSTMSHDFVTVSFSLEIKKFLLSFGSLKELV